MATLTYNQEGPVDLYDIIESVEYSFIHIALKKHSGDMELASKHLSIKRPNLYAKCRRLGINYKKYQPAGQKKR